MDGEAVFEGAPDDSEGFLIFVDEDPDANWAHPCRYVFQSGNGGRAIAWRKWPPSEKVYDKLEEAPRPPKACNVCGLLTTARRNVSGLKSYSLPCCPIHCGGFTTRGVTPEKPTGRIEWLEGLP